jgi:hypothetical protein
MPLAEKVVGGVARCIHFTLPGQSRNKINYANYVLVSSLIAATYRAKIQKIQNLAHASVYLLQEGLN